MATIHCFVTDVCGTYWQRTVSDELLLSHRSCVGGRAVVIAVDAARSPFAWSIAAVALGDRRSIGVIVPSDRSLARGFAKAALDSASERDLPKLPSMETAQITRETRIGETWATRSSALAAGY
jgi:hypothetical protein